MKAIRFFLLISILVASVAMISVASAQESEEDQWSPLRRLSTLGGQASQAKLVADSFGYVHAFWIETGFYEYDRSLIYYSRFDGEDWSEPLSIYASWPDVVIRFLSAAIGPDGELHLVWSEGPNGPLYYTSAESSEAFSAWNWRTPIRIEAEALEPQIVVTEDAVHIVYINYSGEQPGLYYIESYTRGLAWSYPIRIDTDIPSLAAPAWLTYETDDNGYMHILWAYVDTEGSGSLGRWIRYARSLDGGRTWSTPITIDIDDEPEEDELRAAGPILAISGDELQVLWAGNEQLRREQVTSTDSGATWSEPSFVFGELQGAAGDAFAVDGSGAIHFAGQIRWPQGIYHAIWSDGSWSEPEIAYFIRKGSQDEFEDRVHAHQISLAVRAGNQLVMTFTNSPAEAQTVLYSMYRELDDVTAVELNPTPLGRPTPVEDSTLAPTPVEDSTPAPTPEPTSVATGARVSGASRLSIANPSTSLKIFTGIIPVIVLLGSVFAYRSIRRR